MSHTERRLRDALVKIANRAFGPEPTWVRQPEDMWLWALCKSEDTARLALGEGRADGQAGRVGGGIRAELRVGAGVSDGAAGEGAGG